ncbi:MAG TPA: NAD(P)(+) transhydrogenase (Re/Si-specific) subunit beta [Candidatus Eisenbacteria bacterium]|nr:NAD(P)(+) transhydrogenase (Re/Si-specific) subunit beta [Candidatus Eisenbacteria bacterium]
MNLEPVLPYAYLAATVLFVLGLRSLSAPATARSGNLLAAAGMALAVGATIATPGLQHMDLIVLALVIGCVAGALGARTVQMTAMPEMVAMLNGLGGGAAALVSAVEFLRGGPDVPVHGIAGVIALAQSFGSPRTAGHPAGVGTTLGLLIGSISFSGSIVAFGKLHGWVHERALATRMLRVVNGVLIAAVLVAALVVARWGGTAWFATLAAGALLFGVTMVLPIGGADMPVVISLLNSCTGLAAAETGFVLGNDALIIAGTLVGASGTLLTQLMCRAMNRSLASVVMGGFGAHAPAPAHGAGGKPVVAEHPVREIGAEDAAILMSNAREVIIIPGYGMAVAQAQHAVRELADLLTQKGVEVKYAIHPVAGRMPGHMNVLLAEANVPYDQLYDLDAINDEFPRADVALVIGANDVVNPAARTDAASPIYGMPILNADKAQHVIVIKRSLNPGFAGIDNPIYYEPRTMMLFGDAKSAVANVIIAMKDGGG